MTPIDWPDGWVQREPVPHADRDASEVRTYVDEDKPDLRVEITEWKHEPRTCKVWCDGLLRFDGVARAEVEVLAADMDEPEQGDAHEILSAVADRMDQFAYDEISSAISDLLDRIEDKVDKVRVFWMRSTAKAHVARQSAEAEVERLRAEIADRESERADLRDRVEKAEAALAEERALVDRLNRLLGSHADGHRCTCTMVDPGIYHGDNMHPPEWEQDPWCPTHPDADYIGQQYEAMLRRAEKAEAAVGRVEALRDEWKRGYNSPTASSWASAHAERLSTALSGDQ